MPRRGLAPGTGDVKPQLLSYTGSSNTTDNRTIVNIINLPVPRFGTMKNKATIFEILKVYFYPGLDNTIDPIYSNACYLSTQSIFGDDAATSQAILADLHQNPAVFASVQQVWLATVSGATVMKYPLVCDLTDNSGNGILIGTDQIWMTFASFGQIAQAGLNAHVKILYRLVNVGIDEYVGIVQSQVQTSVQ